MADLKKRNSSQDRMTLALDLFIDYLMETYQEENQFSRSSALSHSNSTILKNKTRLPQAPFS